MPQPVAMHLLLTNDDGVDARGISVLGECVRGLGSASVVAPPAGLSGCSHQATTDAPLRVDRLDAHRYAVHGTPADCVRLALLELAADVDWVLAGINDGANLGVDIHMSGTVAAAREAALMGKPAIAISQYRAPARTVDWQHAGDMARHVLQRLTTARLPAAGAFWNVNLPDLHGQRTLPEIVFCPPDACPLPVQYQRRGATYVYRTNYHARPRRSGTDVDVCFRGLIAVSCLLASPAHADG